MSDQDMRSERAAELAATTKPVLPIASGSGVASLNLSAIGSGLFPWDRLPETADDLLEKGFPELAVVVAMTACETIVGRAITVGLQRKGVPELEEPIDNFVSSYTLATNSRVRELYTAVTGDDQIAQQPFWSDLGEAAKARNKTIHEGKLIPMKDARRYIDAAKQAIAYIEKVNDLRT